MQNKGAIKLIAVLLALVCLYQLSFTFFTKKIENQAKDYATVDSIVDPIREFQYLDSMSSVEVYNFLWLRKYTYKDCKERELNLGLDLKGGMNVVLEISMIDILKAMSNYSTDTLFNSALVKAQEMQKNSQDDYITLFQKAYTQLDPNAKLSVVFSTMELKDKINYETSNDEVIKIIRTEADAAFSTSFNVLRNRIDRFGVTQPNIQKLENTNRILIELPGIKEPQRVRKLLQGTASLEFWETYDNTKIAMLLVDADAVIKDYVALGKDTSSVADTTKAKEITEVAEVAADSTNELLDLIKSDTTASKTTASGADQNPLISILSLSVDRQTGQPYPGSTVGYARWSDTSTINKYLALPKVRALLPKDAKFLWSNKATTRFGENVKDIFELHAIRITTRDGRAPLDGSVIIGANKSTSQNQGGWEVDMTMNTEGSRVWARMTRDNIGNSIAIVLDNYIYSSPRVQNEIKGGNSQITGDFTPEEADDLANVLKSGKLPAPAKIVQEAVVGPSLGKKSVQDGMFSFVVAFIVVLLYMWFYYGRAGFAADTALFANVFLIFGTLASFGAVLTLPGIAGIVLTLGMAVDANVIIYERIREELRAGKMVKNAIEDGYKKAYSAIIDGNVTTFITGVVLAWFGTGPIQGFATTLIIGIITSLFTSIFISRLIFEGLLKKGKTISFGNKLTNNLLTNTKLNFIGMRKVLYVFSLVLIVISLFSIFTRGFNYGLDFTGGRNYLVKFDDKVKASPVEIREKLAVEFDGNAPEVKIYGIESQVKIATKFLIDDKRSSAEIDSVLETRLFNAVKSDLKPGTTLEEFRAINIISAEKVGPTVADDIKRSAIYAVLFSLLGIFIYIMIRFNGWRYGVGGIASLAHDTILILGAYSLLYSIMPFSLEIDQSFIAAILTVIGYSINDTVIIYDRIRENMHEHPKWPTLQIFNNAFNSTLSRTLNTALTTIFVLVVIFIFGGEVIRGFVFAMLLGIVVGTYSSIFNASAIVYDLLPNKKKENE